MRRRLILPLVVLIAIGVWAVRRYQEQHAPLQWSGTVESHTIDVGSRLGGRVFTVVVEEGDEVKAGQVLLSLEPGDLPAQRLQAVGQLEQAEAALAKISTKSGTNARGPEIAGARARLQAQQVALEKAKLDDARLAGLFGAGAATSTERDTASLSLRNAAAQLDSAQASLDQLLAGTQSDIKSAQGVVDAATGRLNQIDVMIAELEVKSPRDARVESLALRPGDLLAPNAPAARLLEPGQLYVRIYVPETQIARVHPGLEVPVFVDSFPNEPFKGVVEFVAAQGEFTPRNLQTADERADQVFGTRVRLDPAGAAHLRAGMAAYIQVPR